MARYALRGDQTAFLFVFEADERTLPGSHDVQARKDRLQREFASAGRECRQILAPAQAASDLHFGPVSQIRLDRWWNGRTGLLGDAADAPSLLAGQGAALSIVGAYVMAGELSRAGGDPAAGFARYDADLRAPHEDRNRAAKHRDPSSCAAGRH